MMKKLICQILFLLIGLTSYSQNSIKVKSHSERPFVEVVKNFYSVSGINGKTLFLSSDGGIPIPLVHPGRPRAIFACLENAKKFDISVKIDRDSLKYYRYTVIQDDSVYLAKDLIPKAIKIRGLDTSLSFGPYASANKKFSFFIYEVGHKESGSEIIMFCKKPKAPELVEAFLDEVFKDERVISLKKNSDGDTISIEKSISEGRNLNIQGKSVPMNKNYSYAKISIKPIDNVFLYKVLVKRTSGGRIAFTNIDDVEWQFNEQGNLQCLVAADNFNTPGKYEIIIYPKTGNVNVNNIKYATRINFAMERTEKQIFIFSALAFLAVILVFIIIFFILKRRNKKKLQLAEQQKMISQMQLNAVRSQLNPHFMFNALAGIQSLMNKNKTEEANEYLGKFARITRNVLDNQELTSLADEKALLDDYLQMEQFRFGFIFEIETAKTLDLENTEIPSMLLQPFVENAVKHGIADFGEGGKVSVFFKQKQNDLILEVTDNGRGFDTSQIYQGLGLQLSKDRIALLNDIYKENPFLMEITADDKGTTITIKLVNWL